MKRALLTLVVVPLLGMGFFPTKTYRAVAPFCSAPLDLEVVDANGVGQTIYSGLGEGDCIDIEVALPRRMRLCCPTSPRACGPPLEEIAGPAQCKRTVKP